MQAQLRVGRTADMEQRHGHHVHVVGFELGEGAAGIHGVCQQVALTEPDSLGVSGRTRGVHDHRHVLGRDVGATATRCRGGQHGFVLVGIAALGRDPDDVGDAREAVADRCDPGHEFGADDQQFGAGVVEHVIRLIPGQPEIDDRRRRTQRCRGDRGLDAGGMVLVQESDHVAAADTALGKRSGQPANAVVELRPGPFPVEVNDGDVVGFVFRPVRRSVVEEAGFRRLCHTD